jgi:hypothetical protein
MSYKPQNNKTSRWTNLGSTSKNKTVKNVTKVCNLGVIGTMKPCCNKDKDGIFCHVKPKLLDNTKSLTRSKSKQMSDEHDAYKYEETKLFSSGDVMPTKYDIHRQIISEGLDVVKYDRDRLKKIIKMRTNWLKDWYMEPISGVDCYTCDANARNHNVRIEILKKSLVDYNESINKNEKKTSVSSRTRSKVTPSKVTPSNVTSKQRPKLKLTRPTKKDSYRVDSVARRQKLAAMLVKKKDSQERRKKLSGKNRTTSKNRTTR